jgi:hypothetical protein
MVTMQTFDTALKDIYEEPMRDQINIGSGIFLAKVEQTSKDIEGGRRVYKIAPYGVNGGTGSGSDTQPLPVSGGNLYAPFVSGIKSIRGVIKFTDQVMKASRSSKAAFLSAMESEQDGLLKSARFTYGRQSYLNGTGICTSCGVTNNSVVVNVESTQYLIEGMIIDIVNAQTGVPIDNGTQRRIVAVNRIGSQKSIVLDGTTGVTTTSDHAIVEQGSLNQELTGMEAVFAQSGSLYGLDKSKYPWLVPYRHDLENSAIDDQTIVDTINFVEEYRGSNINLLIANPAVESEYYKYLEATKRSVNTTTLEGGYKSLSVAGRPMVKDRFVKPGCLKLLDTTQWKMHTLDGGDWSWLDEDGKILKWVSGFAMWTAVLIKYCELICDHPGGQAEIVNIATASNLFS